LLKHDVIHLQEIWAHFNQEVQEAGSKDELEDLMSKQHKSLEYQY